MVMNKAMAMSVKITRIIGLLGVALVIIGLFMVFLPRDTNAPESIESRHSLRVVASFFPYAEFAQAVVGSDGSVTTVVPAGVEPHDFEPTPRDIESLYQADVVIINGAGIDMWAEKLIPALNARGVRVLRMSDTVALLPSTGMGHAHESKEEHEEEGHEEEGENDPHFWLDPVLAQAQVESIASALSEVDPSKSAGFKARAAAFVRELAELDRSYREGLGACPLQSVVTSHDAFGYLAKRYTLEVISIAGLSPNAEPSPRRLSEIVEMVRERDIQYIFFEALSSPKLAETVAREVGIQTLPFNPIEGGIIRADGTAETYMGLMRENLNHLQTALACQ